MFGFSSSSRSVFDQKAVFFLLSDKKPHSWLPARKQSAPRPSLQPAWEQSAACSSQGAWYLPMDMVEANKRWKVECWTHARIKSACTDILQGYVFGALHVRPTCNGLECVPVFASNRVRLENECCLNVVMMFLCGSAVGCFLEGCLCCVSG